MCIPVRNVDKLEERTTVVAVTNAYPNTNSNTNTNYSSEIEEPAKPKNPRTSVGSQRPGMLEL